jgi:hypothetical protein
MQRKPSTLVVLCLAACLLPTATAVASSEATFFRGEVQAATGPTGKLVVVVDSASKKRQSDGIADEVFILRQEVDQAVDVTIEPTRAQVMYTGRSLRIMLEGGSNILLTLDETAGTKGVQIVRGYGLIHLSSGFEEPAGLTLQEFLRDEPVAPPSLATGTDGLCPDGGGGVYCDAGGCGSTQCSVTGCYEFPTACDVTCSGETFACCQCPAGHGGHCDCESNSNCHGSGCS